MLRIFIKVIATIVLMFILSSCGIDKPEFPTGDFIDSQDVILRIKPDEQCEAIYSVTGEVVASGPCTADGDIVTFVEYEQCPGIEGIYKWSLDGDKLRFELIEDSCENRIKSLSQEHTRYTEDQ
jgi:hypothetical protein